MPKTFQNAPSFKSNTKQALKLRSDCICVLAEYWLRLSCIRSSENTWSACKMLTNSCLNNSFPLTNCSGSISSSVESENKLFPRQEQISNPCTCILAKHISNPNCWWDARSEEHQYILLDASMCGFNSSTFIDLCKHVFLYKGNEFRILAMSTIMAKPV
jgi:hypothetical protein